MMTNTDVLASCHEAALRVCVLATTLVGGLSCGLAVRLWRLGLAVCKLMTY